MRNEAKTNFSSECDVLFLKLLDFETFQFLGFCIEKIWYPKKYRIPYQKIWYRKKFWIQFRSDLGYFGWSLRFKNSMFWSFSIFFMIRDSVLKNLVLKKRKKLDLVSTKLGIKKVPAFDYQCREYLQRRKYFRGPTEQFDK